MRRTTLSTLDMNRSLDGDASFVGGDGPAPLSKRKSFGAPVSTKKAAAHSSRTSSAAPPGGASLGLDPRRSSLLGSRGGLTGTGLADPRPLGSKQWMTDNVDKLAKFLMDNDYPQRITAKLLQSPTGKDFQSILTFLLRLLDPTFALSSGPGKMEDEVHAVFKSLRYPFALSKTALGAVGAQQSWPAVMGAIMWLLELLEYDALVASADDGAEREPRAGEPAFFFNYVRVAYERFLAEDDAKVEELRATVAAAFGEQHELLAGGNAGVRAENERLKAELTALRAQASKLPTLRKTASELASESENLRDRLADAERYVADITSRCEDKTRERDARAQELERAQAGLAAAQGAVRSQALSLSDVEALRKKAAGVRDSVARMAGERRAVEEETAALAHQLGSALEALRGRVGEYEGASGRLHITPTTAKYSAGIDFSLGLDEGFLAASVGPHGAVIPTELLASLGGSGGLDDTAVGAGLLSATTAGPCAGGGIGACTATSSALLGNDMKGVIKQGLRAMRARFGESASEAARSVARHEEALARLRDGAKDAARRNDALARQLREREGAVEAHRSELAAGLAGSEQRIGRMEGEIASARSELVTAQAAARELAPELLAGAARQVESHLATLARQRAHTAGVVARVMNATLMHKGGVDDKLRGLLENLAGRVEACAASRGPAAAGAAGGSSSLNTSLASLGCAPLTALNASLLSSAGAPPPAAAYPSVVAAAGPPSSLSARPSILPRPGPARYSLLPGGGSSSSASAVAAAAGAGARQQRQQRAAKSRESMTMMGPGSLAELMAAEGTDGDE